MIIREAMINYACQVLGRSPKTAKDYTESMERYLPRFMKTYMSIENVESIYDIHELKQLESIYNRIKENREWMEINQRSHGSTFTSGLKCYMKFIQSDYYPFKEERHILFDSTKYEDLSDEDSISHKEGQAYVSHCVGYERNKNARQECLKHYGYKCAVCGFDFEKEYGKIGHKFIEVHHIVPIATIGKEYIIDPIRDLRPLCSNCHSMIHRGSEVLTIDELRKMKESSTRTND